MAPTIAISQNCTRDFNFYERHSDLEGSREAECKRGSVIIWDLEQEQVLPYP